MQQTKKMLNLTQRNSEFYHQFGQIYRYSGVSLMKKKNEEKMQLEEYPEVFADIVNVLIFDGENVVKPEELSDIPTLPKKRNKFEHQVSKVWKAGHLRFSYLAFEKPVNFNRYIPLCSIGYDGKLYEDELKTAKSTSELYPVINIVLYLGYENRWNAPLSLNKCFNMPKRLQSYLSDYKTNLFEVAWLSDETVAKFQSDFRFIAEYCTQAQKKVLWEPMYGEAEHINEVFEMLYDMTDDERFLIVLEEPRLGGNSTMPSVVLDRIQYMGMMLGRDDGLTTGREYGKEDLARMLLQKGKVTVEDIQEVTGWKKTKIEELLVDDDSKPHEKFKRRVLK